MKLECRVSYLSAALTTVPSYGSMLETNSKLTSKRVTVYSMYIHGGRDLKEGPIASLWRVNLSAIQKMKSNPTNPVSWELINSSGRDIGRISHHTCALVSAKEVVFFGGLKGEDSSKSAFILNLLNNSWSNVVLKVS